MIIQKTFSINSWKDWDYTIDDCVEEFYSCHSIYPNILIANPYTLSKIDVAANSNKEYISNLTGCNPAKNIFAKLSYFISTDYKLEFCIDSNVPDNYFYLIYHLDPGNGGEPIPDKENKLQKTGIPGSYNAA